MNVVSYTAIDAPLTRGFDIHTETNLPVFASDISNSGAKTFYTCGYDYFVHHHYPSLRQHHEYEVLRWNRPTKLFFDLDASAEAMTKHQFDDTCEHVIDQVRSMCEYYLQLEDVPQAVVLIGSSASKHSAHIIFDVVLETMEQVKMFVTHGFADLAVVDKSVYSRNRSFRLLGSCKLGKHSRLRLPHTDTYSPVDLFRSMVQAVLPSECADNTLAYEGRPEFAYTFNMGTPSSSAPLTSSQFTPPAALVDHIAALGGRIRSGREDQFNYTFIVQKLHCPFAKRAHKSNNMFLNIKKSTMHGYMVCADPECPRLRFWADNFLWTFAAKSPP